MTEIDPRIEERPANDSASWASRTGGAPPSRRAGGRIVTWLAVAVAVGTTGLWLTGIQPPTTIFADAFKPKVKVEVVHDGTGLPPARSDVVLINYKGTLPDGKVIDQAQNAVLVLDSVIPGFTDALIQMKKGGKYKAFIPSELGYGASGTGPIPPNADLLFEIDLIDFKPRAEYEQYLKSAQQQQPQPNGPGSGQPSAAGDPPTPR